jgi:hypothetical protein
MPKPILCALTSMGGRCTTTSKVGSPILHTWRRYTGGNATASRGC